MLSVAIKHRFLEMLKRNLAWKGHSVKREKKRICTLCRTNCMRWGKQDRAGNRAWYAWSPGFKPRQPTDGGAGEAEEQVRQSGRPRLVTLTHISGCSVILPKYFFFCCSFPARITGICYQGKLTLGQQDVLLVMQLQKHSPTNEKELPASQKDRIQRTGICSELRSHWARSHVYQSKLLTLYAGSLAVYNHQQQ